MNPAAHAPTRADRIGLGIGLLVGVPLMLIGALGIYHHTDATPPSSYFRFFIGGDILHDAIVGPIVALVAFFVLRRVPPIVKAPLRAALFGSAICVAIAWPGIRHYGRMRTPDNPSVQPLNYANSTLTAVGIVVLICAIWLAIAMFRAHRHDTDDSQPILSSGS